ncbi:MAG: DNA replication/repair protein RecF [Thalassotalea sp.]
MSVEKLTTHAFRNLANKSLHFHPDLNFILGDNGSGKSSLLEAIFFLGHGKSFRTSKTENLACFDENKFVVSISSFNDLKLGIAKTIDTGQVEIKLNGEKLNRLSDLAKNFAVQIITPESFKLFFGGPRERRKFLDLGMFHVKQQFSNNWRDFSKVLKHRNACLRNISQRSMLPYWTEQFCLLSDKIANDRLDYVENLARELHQWLGYLLPDFKEKISVQYLRGWNLKKDLATALSDNFDRELELGYTASGPHKFDIRFNIGRQPLENTLSRGQQKLFLLALTLSQAKLIENVKRLKPILLIDDIGAELDFNSRTALSTAIKSLDCQVIISAIEKTVLEPIIPADNNYKMFHVKQGEILEIIE